MKTTARLTIWMFIVRLFSLPNVVFLLLLISILFTGLLAMTAEQKGFASAYAMSLPSGVQSFAMPITTLVAGSAHYNVWEATTYHFLHSTPPKGGILLPLRFIAKWLVVLLPLAGFIRSYSSISSEIETNVIQSLFSLPVRRALLAAGKMIGDALATGLTLTAGMGFALFLAGRATHLAYTTAQLVRAFIFLGIMGIYAALFIFWGTAISAWARRSSKALLICTATVVGLFLISVVAENLSRIDARGSFSIPAMSPQVNEYLHDVGLGLRSPTAEVPEEVAAYLKELREYGNRVYHTLSASYSAERWWNFISPIQLTLEIAAQLLQDEYKSAVDVFSVERSENSPPSLSASLELVIPELVWLSSLCMGGLTLAGWLISRLEV